MDASTTDALLDERALSKLKWRCRRGLLENDLFIERFFARHESGLTVRQANALGHRLLREHAEREKQYDRDTRHGASQGARLE